MSLQVWDLLVFCADQGQPGLWSVRFRGIYAYAYVIHNNQQRAITEMSHEWQYTQSYMDAIMESFGACLHEHMMDRWS